MVINVSHVLFYDDDKRNTMVNLCNVIIPRLYDESKKSLASLFRLLRQILGISVCGEGGIYCRAKVVMQNVRHEKSEISPN